MLTLLGTEILLFPGGWKLPALQGTLPEASVRQAGHQVQVVVAERGFRRPNDLVNSEKDREVLLGLQNAMFGQPSGQLPDWIFVAECVFSCKTFKQMAWAETSYNGKQSGQLSAQP